MKLGNIARLALIAAIVVLAVVLGVRFDVQSLLRDLLAWVESQGFTGVLVFIAVYIFATVFFIPGSILTLGAGAVFGVGAGTVWVSAASTLGAFAAFLTGRYIARGWVAAKIDDNPRFAAIDKAVGREGWKIVLLTRLSPIFPFNLLNYAYGLTAVSAPSYFFSSWIGMLPGTVMYVYIGSLAANLATLGSASGERDTVQWILYGVGLVATIAVTLFVTRIARRALKTAIDDTSDTSTTNGNQEVES
ncbi:MAG: TVP38/TMEM64 family protein [Spirochaetales bacterium]|nr:TVP38/TMEM64 family protein [Spirochaetales bacterium]